jgi:hypothetical protein
LDATVIAAGEFEEFVWELVFSACFGFCGGFHFEFFVDSLVGVECGFDSSWVICYLLQIRVPLRAGLDFIDADE